jgi:plastocyanin
MKKNLWFAVVAVVLVTLLVSAACQSQPAAGKTVEITVATTEFKFNPDTITVKVGDHVKVTLDNSKGTLKHDFVQSDLNINASVEAGQKSTFEFTPTKAGTFDFTCDVPGHQEAGMVGKIVVQP